MHRYLIIFSPKVDDLYALRMIFSFQCFVFFIVHVNLVMI